MRTTALASLVLLTGAALGACSAASERDGSSDDAILLLPHPPIPRPIPLPAPQTALGFAGWKGFPIGGTTQTADAAVAFQGRLYVFGLGIGDHGHYVSSFDGLSWSAWSLLAGGPPSIVSDAATVFNGRLYVFGVSNADHKHYVNSFDGASWSGWSQVPGGGTSPIGDAVAVINGKLRLFGIGYDDHHYVNAFDGASWSGWSAIPGAATTTVADSAATYGGQLYLLSTGTDHQPYVNVMSPLGTWSGWSLVPAGNAVGASNFALSAVSYASKLQVFSVTTDGLHKVNAYDLSTGAWTGWATIPGAQSAITGDAAATYHGRLFVVGVDAGGHHSFDVASDHAALPPYNQVGFTSTHNSYWVNRDNVFEIGASGTQERLVDQGIFEGVRSFEIDIHRDDTTPHNFTVYHSYLPSNSLCVQLEDCLREFLDLQHVVPDHDPITLVIELKEVDSGEDPFDGAHTPADLDAILERQLGPYLARPRDLCPGTNDLRACAKNGWPTIDQLRGKFLATIIGNWGKRDACVRADPDNMQGWVEYANQPGGIQARTAFLMESPWVTSSIACEEPGVNQAMVDVAVKAAPFVEYEPGDASGLPALHDQWVAQNLVVRSDLGGQNDETVADQQAMLGAGVTLLQSDHPWVNMTFPPLRVDTPMTPLADVNAMNEPGHRVRLLQLASGATQNVPYVFGPGVSARWETTVSDTRPATSPNQGNDVLNNPFKPRGEGCLYATTPSDVNGNGKYGLRICRTTADGHWNVSKPLGEDVILEVTTFTNGVASTSTSYSDDRDPWGNGEMLRIDVSQNNGSACATAYSSEVTIDDVPQWKQVQSACFAGVQLTEQGLRASSGDVVFAGTKVAYAVAPSAPLVATDDYEPQSGATSSYVIQNLSWPAPPVPPPSTTPIN